MYEEDEGLPRLLRGQESACNAGDIGMQVWFLDCKVPLEEEIATHSSLLAWKAPWSEEPGGIRFMGRQELDKTEGTEH